MAWWVQETRVRRLVEKTMRAGVWALCDAGRGRNRKPCLPKGIKSKNTLEQNCQSGIEGWREQGVWEDYQVEVTGKVIAQLHCATEEIEPISTQKACRGQGDMGRNGNRKEKNYNWLEHWILLLCHKWRQVNRPATLSITICFRWCSQEWKTVDPHLYVPNKNWRSSHSGQIQQRSGLLWQNYRWHVWPPISAKLNMRCLFVSGKLILVFCTYYWHCNTSFFN